jgi:hypothetical protein
MSAADKSGIAAEIRSTPLAGHKLLVEQFGLEAKALHYMSRAEPACVAAAVTLFRS